MRLPSSSGCPDRGGHRQFRAWAELPSLLSNIPGEVGDCNSSLGATEDHRGFSARRLTAPIRRGAGRRSRHRQGVRCPREPRLAGSASGLFTPSRHAGLTHFFLWAPAWAFQDWGCSSGALGADPASRGKGRACVSATILYGPWASQRPWKSHPTAPCLGFPICRWAGRDRLPPGAMLELKKRLWPVDSSGQSRPVSGGRCR